MFTEDDLLPISALQHVIFCERQAALIHVERAWQENVHTVEGRHLHDAADDGGSESRGDLRVVRSLPLRNLELGLAGIADVVEFRRACDAWIPFPVEYKKGKRKRHRADEVQVCAQAMCLEEMFRTDVPEGALFYGRPRRRTAVSFDQRLRELTRAAAVRFREIVEAGTTPPAPDDARCRECSLIDLCRPHAARRSASRYVATILRSASGGED